MFKKRYENRKFTNVIIITIYAKTRLFAMFCLYNLKIRIINKYFKYYTQKYFLGDGEERGGGGFDY